MAYGSSQSYPTLLAKVGLWFPSGVELLSSHPARLCDVQLWRERVVQDSPTSTSGAGLRIRGQL
jgi:hypothetical protein